MNGGGYSSQGGSYAQGTNPAGTNPRDSNPSGTAPLGFLSLPGNGGLFSGAGGYMPSDAPPYPYPNVVPIFGSGVTATPCPSSGHGAGHMGSGGSTGYCPRASGTGNSGSYNTGNSGAPAPYPTGDMGSWESGDSGNYPGAGGTGNAGSYNIGNSGASAPCPTDNPGSGGGGTGTSGSYNTGDSGDSAPYPTDTGGNEGSYLDLGDVGDSGSSGMYPGAGGTGNIGGGGGVSPPYPMSTAGSGGDYSGSGNPPASWAEMAPAVTVTETVSVTITVTQSGSDGGSETSLGGSGGGGDGGGGYTSAYLPLGDETAIPTAPFGNTGTGTGAMLYPTGGPYRNSTIPGEEGRADDQPTDVAGVSAEGSAGNEGPQGGGQGNAGGEMTGLPRIKPPGMEMPTAGDSDAMGLGPELAGSSEAAAGDEAGSSSES
ncbi:MAG: hypothetical protein Q9185_000825 [Variospora sp. 1 TL-2023]